MQAFTGKATGALTYSFIHAMENERKLTYGHMLTAMRNKVREAQQVLGLNAPFASSKSQVCLFKFVNILCLFQCD